MSSITTSVHKTLKRIVPKKVDFSAVLVVYKSKDGYWKAFAHPYNVTAQASTKNVALKRLKESVEIYQTELEKFSFPSHLVQQPLTDIEDREIFSRVIDDAIEKKGIIDQSDYHAETYKVRS